MKFRWIPLGVGLLSITLLCSHSVVSQKMSEGELLFLKHCASCHEKGGIGKVKGHEKFPPLLGKALKISLEELQAQVRNGRNGRPKMAPIKILQPGDVEKIYCYLQTLKEPGVDSYSPTMEWKEMKDKNIFPSPVPNAPVGKENSPGEKVFNENCLICHGIAGAGREVDGKKYPTLEGAGQRYSKPEFSMLLRKGRNGNPAMPFFGHLSEKDVDAVFEYVKTIVKK
ncbi:MAG: cytochrome c [Armatimonadetes bacterium]|nr:cytochrome c [Armatimonadota bacterium]